MVLPERMPPIGSDFEQFRELSRLADYYINERGISDVETKKRIGEVAGLLNAEAEFLLGRRVILGGILKKAELHKRNQPDLGGNRHLEETRVIGLAAGIIIVDLETDFEDVNDKSPRQDKLLDEIIARSQGRYGVGYLVDVGVPRMNRSSDFLQRSQNVRSVFGLAMSSTITLEEIAEIDDGAFGIEDAQEAEILRVISSIPEFVQTTVHFVGEQLIDSEDKLAILTKNAKMLRYLLRQDNPVELMAIVDYFGHLMGYEFINRTLQFENPLPLLLERLEGDDFRFSYLDSSKVTGLFVGGMGVAPAFRTSEDGESAELLPYPNIYLHTYPVIGDKIEARTILVPVEELEGNPYKEVALPTNFSVEEVADLISDPTL